MIGICLFCFWDCLVLVCENAEEASGGGGEKMSALGKGCSAWGVKGLWGSEMQIEGSWLGEGRRNNGLLQRCRWSMSTEEGIVDP